MDPILIGSVAWLVTLFGWLLKCYIKSLRYTWPLKNRWAVALKWVRFHLEEAVYVASITYLFATLAATIAKGLL